MQTTYKLTPDAAKLGMIADSRLGGPVMTARSLALAPVGRFYVRDTSSAGVDNLVKLPSASSDVAIANLMGILTLSDTLENDPTVTYPQFPIGHPLPLVRRNGIWVWCETAFAPSTDTLYLRYAVNGAGTAAGQVANASDAGNNATMASLPVRGMNTLTAAGLLLVEISLP